MDLGWGSRIAGESGSALVSEPVNGWERGAIRGGGRMAGAGGTTLITTTSVSIISTFTTIGGRAWCMSSTTMGSTPGTAGNGRTIGAPTSTRTQAVSLITAVSSGWAPTTATFTLMFPKRLWHRADSTNTMFMAVETEPSIATIHQAHGSETRDKAGRGRRRPRALNWNGTLMAATWANNGSTTFVRLAAA